MSIFKVTRYKESAPRPYTATTITRALTEDLMEARNVTGAIMHNKATHIVRVKKIDTPVFMAKICPNLAKS